jgi:DNA-3-methyladenine glycosylase I
LSTKNNYLNIHEARVDTPLHDDRKVIEFLILEGFQTGLSWITILRKRENFRQAFINIRKEFGTFDRYFWGFINGKPLNSKLKSFSKMPAKTALSDRISLDLKKRGFKFVGSTIVYSHLQATGMVNDHLVTCYYTDLVKRIK